MRRPGWRKGFRDAPQLPAFVIDAAGAYLRDSFVQTGADYQRSKVATQTVASAHQLAATFLNAPADGTVILGASSTALTHLAANAMGDALGSGDLPSQRNELIVSSAGHEANVWPWARLAARGFVIRWWHPIPDASGRWTLDMAALKSMLSDRTALVAFPQVSNVLGDVWDARQACELAAAAGARSYVDGVAYAPHHLPDVRQLGCDWYVYSTYKVFGPHMAALYGAGPAMAPLTGPNHPFIARTLLPYKFELGGVNHECAAMLAASGRYFAWLAGEDQPASAPSRSVLERAFGAIDRAEAPLQEQLISGLKRTAGVRLVGSDATDASRVCTVSFVVSKATSGSIARALNAQDFGCRFGHFYSRRLVEQMGLDPDDGVVRVSLAHYNSHDEVDRLLAALRALL
ncbi:MAG: aminotransferase class V-fold PLP-dependent enzyme [Planctomycetota bacterium]|nr:aminotransferase class V-fold PLP-dependent enzyme [Planctomycetota bacterium]